MRHCLFLLLSTCIAAQDTAIYRNYSVDVNGQRVSGPEITETKTKTSYERTERLQSINGRLVPLERIEERIIRDDSSGRVLERTVHRFDPDGHPSPPEQSLIEEHKGPGGTSSLRTTTYRADINGHLQVAERSATETHKTGSTETAETVVERPTINGSLELVEKSSVVKTGSGTGFRQDATTYRKGANGFYEALRLVTDHTQQGKNTSDQTAEYEVGSSGTLELHSQKVSTAARRADGSGTEVVDWFGQSVPGIVGTSGSGLKLKERDTIERTIDTDGSTRETSRVQHTLVSDPKVLGPSKIISELVCRGKCHE